MNKRPVNLIAKDLSNRLNVLTNSAIAHNAVILEGHPTWSGLLYLFFRIFLFSSSESSTPFTDLNSLLSVVSRFLVCFNYHYCINFL
jgi:hypothetical protein